MEENNNPVQNPQANVATKKITVPGLVGFILSLVGLLFFGIPLGITSVILGIVGMVKFDANTQKGKGFAIASIIIGALDIVGAIFGVILMGIIAGSMY